ncbi:MAG: FecCD family ABC transporter permease [Dehalococcoidia bacterium]
MLAGTSDLQAKRPPIFNLRAGPVSLRFNLRVLVLIVASLLLLLLLAAWATTLGSFHVPLDEVVKAAVGDSTRQNEFVVQSLRLPRVAVAICVGCALAMSGAIFQGLVRNPLVSPDIIGINAGASVVAVWWLVTGKDTAFLPLVAFGGAVGAAALIYLLTWRGGISGNRLILVGIGMNAMLSAATTYLLVKYPIDRVSNAVLWTTGSIYGSDWGDVRVIAAALLFLIPLGVVLMISLRVLQFGDDTAASLGMVVEPTRLMLILVGCALAAVSVSLAGPIGFVALIVPHVARMIAGPMTGAVLLLTGVLGALLLLGADVVAQHYLPVTLPVGVVTAVIGAPYFLLLLYRSNTRV